MRTGNQVLEIGHALSEHAVEVDRAVGLDQPPEQPGVVGQEQRMIRHYGKADRLGPPC